MSWAHYDVRRGAGVQTLAIELRHSAAPKGYDLSGLIWLAFAAFSPERHLNTDALFVAYSECPLVARCSVFHIEASDRTNLENDTNYVDSTLLNEFFNALQTRERVCIAFDLCVLSTLLDLCTVFKGDAVVVLD